MGLRIIERSIKRRVEVSDSERQTGLEQEARHWVTVKGGSDDDKSKFIDKFTRIRARLTTSDDMERMATQLRDRITSREPGPAAAHGNKVDIATLLELL